MTTLRETYGYDPYTLKADVDRMMAILRVVLVTDNPTVLEAWRQLETLTGVACADALRHARTIGQFREVHIIESERGWGQKVDERLYFLSTEHAEKFVADYNRKSMADETAPEIYWRAVLVPIQ